MYITWLVEGPYRGRWVCSGIRFMGAFRLTGLVSIFGV